MRWVIVIVKKFRMKCSAYLYVSVASEHFGVHLKKWMCVVCAYVCVDTIYCPHFGYIVYAPLV